MSSTSSSPIPTVIDGRFLLERRPTGTHRSALGFSRALLAHKDRLQVRICTDVTRVSEENRQQLDGAEWSHTPLSNKYNAHLWEQFKLPRQWPDAVQLYLINTGPFVFPTRRQIVFVHDIHFLTSPHVFSHAFRLWNRAACAFAAQRARHVICFTEHVKAELVHRLNIASDRIRVVPQGPGIDVNAEVTETSNIPERFFLCVGGLQPHKNLKATLDSFAKSGLPEDGYKLVVIGRKQEGFARLDIHENMINAPWLKFTGYISDGELLAYYLRAIGLVYVSIMEGFGLPLVEGFHVGCPVITSTFSCLPEVAGNAAIVVDPFDLDAIGAAMRKLASDPTLREALIVRGRERAQLYTWTRAGAEVLDEIERVSEE